MKNMPNIKLTEKEVQHFMTYRKLFMGGEAIICESDQPYTLYKIFTNYSKILHMGENKEKKIIELYNRQLDHSVKPVSTISLNDVIIGYEMVNEYDLSSYKLFQLSKDELLYFLNKTKEILEYFENEGIIYGDMEPRNILFNKETGEIKFCDMDNIQIDDYKMDLIPSGLLEYKTMRGIDKGVHPYMHNKMTLSALGLDIFCSNKWELRKFLKKDGCNIVGSMKDINMFNSEYLLPHIKKYK